MRIDKKIAPYLFLAPAILFYAVFFILPVGFAAYVSLHSWNMLTPIGAMEWNGIENYERLLVHDDLFPRVLMNTLLFSGGQVVLAVAIALPLAVFILRSRRKVIWRTVYFLPLVTSVVAISYLWMFLYHPGYGLLNSILRLGGIAGLQWVSSPDSAMLSVIIVAVWANLGVFILLFLIGMENIPPVYYEAARIDGANGWQNFKRITLPMLKPTLLFVVIYGMITSLQAFALILIMTGGGPANSTRVLALYMYEKAFEQLKMGEATAMVFILFIVVFAVTLIQLRLFKRGGVEAY
jgi:multiple sugar transport system permease protein